MARYNKRCMACGGKAREDLVPDGQGGTDWVGFCKTPDCINYDQKLRDRSRKVYQSMSIEKDAAEILNRWTKVLPGYGEKMTLSQAIRKANALLVCPDCDRVCGHAFTRVCATKVEDRKAKEDFERFLENPGRDHEGTGGVSTDKAV